MDPKAAAKSKRSQSLQGKRNHPTPSAASAHKKQELHSQRRQPPQGGPPTSRGHQRDLPLNWDRYGGGDDAVLQGDDGVSSSVRKDGHEEVGTKVGKKPLAGGAATPKSKGADFRYLIEQARSQERDGGCDYGGGTASVSLDDVTLRGLFYGQTSIISLKGENLLSLCNEDNFTEDSDAEPSFEVPFLSLDAHALAAQLSKLSMAQLLFIEDDELPAELLQDTDKLEDNDIQIHLVETEQSSESKHYQSDDACPVVKNLQVVGSQCEFDPSVAAEDHDPLQSLLQTSLSGQDIEKEVTEPMESLEYENKRSIIKNSESSSDVTVKDSFYEFASAEAELDMLLDSFGVTNDFTSRTSCNNMSETNNGPTLAQSSSGSLVTGSSTFRNDGPGIALEDTVDYTLPANTASSCLDMRGSNDSSETLMKPCDLSIGMGAGSLRIDLSDSKNTVSLDKSIDDLLAETSFFDSFGLADLSSSGFTQGRSHGSSARAGSAQHSALTASAISVDETIDILLAETSSDLRNHEPSLHTQGKSHVSYAKRNASIAPDDIR